MDAETIEESSINPADMELEKLVTADQVPKFRGITAAAVALGIQEVPIGTQDNTLLVVDEDGKAYPMFEFAQRLAERANEVELMYETIQKTASMVQDLEVKLKMLISEMDLAKQQRG
jgi:molybdate-binding protein